MGSFISSPDGIWEKANYVFFIVFNFHKVKANGLINTIEIELIQLVQLRSGTVAVEYDIYAYVMLPFSRFL